MVKSKTPPTNLPSNLRKALKSLRENKDIIILPADKGKATVVMNKSDYEDKMNHMLSDEQTYSKVDKDPASSMERKLNSLLLSLKKKGSLCPGTYNRLRSTGGLTPYIYGLPKIHKPDVPLRPIVSFCTSPTYQLSKFLARLLSPLVGNSTSYVKNSAEFQSFISSERLNSDEILVSFDVVSLFTKVPIGLAVDVARKRLSLDETLEARTNLSVSEIVNLLEFCLNATYLAFRGNVYRQVYGTAMGSPVSVTVANLVMEDIEERALSTFGIQLPFWKRYVDDTCTAVPIQRKDDLLRHLNQVEDSIKFTVEEEVDGCLPFLDISIKHHTDGSLSTSVFRKKTHTDKYLDFESHHPLTHKKAVVSTLLCRAFTHMSDRVSETKEIRHVTNALRRNGYPQWLIDKQVSTPHTISTTDHQWKGTAVLPYIRGLSESIRRVLSSLDVRVCFKPHTTLRCFFPSPKDRPDDLESAGVVYNIPCMDCSSCYIGQTGRKLGIRIKEHKRAVQTADFVTSALSEHAWTEQHRVDWSNVQILARQSDCTSRTVMESVLIRTTKDTLNRDSGALPLEYQHLF